MKTLSICFYCAFFSLNILLIGCSNNSPTAETKPADTIKIKEVVVVSDNPDYKKGLQLVAQSDCFTCHDIDKKLTGPSYKDIAQKYTEKDIPVLAETIIKGSKGKWSSIPMTPHPTPSKEDAAQMVKYILLLQSTQP